MTLESKRTGHYNDWPNTCGFNVTYEEREPRDLEISGTIPAYCAGVLFRNGLGPLSLNTEGKKNKQYRTNHWFDCLSQVHRFELHPPTEKGKSVQRVSHNSRRTCDALIKSIQETGDRSGVTFAAKYEPCRTFFGKVQSVFSGIVSSKHPADMNVGVTLSPNFPGFAKTAERQMAPPDRPGIHNLYNKTDSSIVQALDPETLEPLGIASQAVLHPDLKGPCSGAHAKVCPKTNDVYNYNLEFGPSGTYRVFHVSAATGKCTILASFSGQAAYLHSSFLTENYYIVCVWNSHFTLSGISILWNKNFVDSLADFDPRKPAKWYVVDRKLPSEGGKGLVATFESDPFFCFHTINAYEETDASGKVSIVADLCAYDNLDILKRFYVENISSDSKTAAAYHDPKWTSSKFYYKQFRLSDIHGAGRANRKVETLAQGSKGLAPELPSFNQRFNGRKHRYVYGVTDTGKSVFLDGIVKYDTVKNAPAAIWSEHGHTAGEAIFIPDPEATPDEEDKGVLLTAVLDGHAERTYLLVLNAQDLTELGRATMPEGPGAVVGFGFHGRHVGTHRGPTEARL